MLGKITDVGLFTEKSEVTINHRSTEDLVNSVRAKIHKLMHPEDVTDVKAVEVNGESIDVDEELGLDTESQTTEEGIIYDDEPEKNPKGQTEND